MLHTAGGSTMMKQLGQQGHMHSGHPQMSQHQQREREEQQQQLLAMVRI